MLKLSRTIEIRMDFFILDADGFSVKENRLIRRVKAYREGRHGSSMWSNLAAFSGATDLFIIRSIPGITITTDMYILDDGKKFDIESVESIKGKGMYVQMLAEKVEATGGESTV